MVRLRILFQKLIKIREEVACSFGMSQHHRGDSNSGRGKRGVCHKSTNAEGGRVAGERRAGLKCADCTEGVGLTLGAPWQEASP